MDGAPVGLRGEGQAYGLAAGLKPLVLMRYRSKNRCAAILYVPCDQDHRTA